MEIKRIRDMIATGILQPSQLIAPGSEQHVFGFRRKLRDQLLLILTRTAATGASHVRQELQKQGVTAR